MEQLLQTLVDGLADGSIYAALALAIVLIFRSTGIVNFAQGEMAMFSTFIAWGLLQAGLPLGVAFVATLALSLLAGMAIERVVIRRVEGSGALTVVIVTLGLFLLINSAAAWIWGFNNRAFPSLFPDEVLDIGGVRLPVESLGIVVTLLVTVAVLHLVLHKTKVGLGLRAVSLDPDGSRLAGIRVGRMLMLGWGIAAMLGALAGMLIAPRLFLGVHLMSGVLIYAFAAAALGGFDSPLGAIAGGWIIGISENLAATYVDFIGADLKILVPLLIIFTVLLVRPAGLFGTHVAVRA